MPPKKSKLVETEELNQEEEVNSDMDQEDSEGSSIEDVIDPSSPVYNLRRRPIHRVAKPSATAHEKEMTTETVEMQTKIKRTRETIRMKKEKDQGTTENLRPPNSTMWKKLIVFTLTIVALIALLWHFNILLLNSQKSAANSPLDVAQIIKGLQEKFSGQSKLTFNIIRASLVNVVKPNPPAPAIIMLLASNNAKDTAEMFADDLVKSISKSPVIIDGSRSMTKLDVEQKINNGLINTSEVGVVYLKNLDRMDRESASILHAFCDHENANYKKAAFVMTVFTEEDIPTKFDSKTADEVAYKTLSVVWDRAKYTDQVSSLLARITVSVAPVLPTAIVMKSIKF